MSEKLKNKDIKEFVNQNYKYGFSTEIESDNLENGLNEEIIKLITKKKSEPELLLNFRLRAYKKWKKMKYPEWSNLQFPEINFQDVIYYSAPKQEKQLSKLDEADPELLKTFEKLGIPLTEQKRLANVAVDAVFDSTSIGTTYKQELIALNIIFTSISEAAWEYPELIKSHLGRAVPIGDNYYSTLNSAVFTDGSFCYIPKDTICPFELSTYFRINERKSGQFERTLIIAKENSYLSYLEGCTAPQYDDNQLHAAVVELIVYDNAEIKYSTVQNWFIGDQFGMGGIMNLVTKRGLCLGINSKISWTQVETGSGITWKYPSCYLVGKNSQGEFYSVAFTKEYQQTDTGSKMLHVGSDTRSRIISKGICAGKSKNIYRGSVKITKKAKAARNYSQCDSLIIGNLATSNTIPYISVRNPITKIEHEASVGNVGQDQIFYCLQRGIPAEEAITMLISGFCQEVFNKLPLEFSVEADYLLRLKLEGTIG
uniref:Iron-sulfur cluster formation ABC transporter n=1 Tax=Coscinodiscus radiatus TaxID=33642 RepID=A0A023HA70_9STRA|nr:iron-sulfur cluster formation ABC transporter [Coscinodiscus radiatus]AGH28461.1 iron-sulfur cluster formation ABC transporter [Coscinodiscus radiatus]